MVHLMVRRRLSTVRLSGNGSGISSGVAGMSSSVGGLLLGWQPSWERVLVVHTLSSKSRMGTEHWPSRGGLKGGTAPIFRSY